MWSEYVSQVFRMEILAHPFTMKNQGVKVVLFIKSTVAHKQKLPPSVKPGRMPAMIVFEYEIRLSKGNQSIHKSLALSRHSIDIERSAQRQYV